MAQLSLYIDELTLEELKKAAGMEKISLSKFVVKKLRESIHNQWPENYRALFGAVTDESFSLKEKMDFSSDSPREEL